MESPCRRAGVRRYRLSEEVKVGVRGDEESAPAKAAPPLFQADELHRAELRQVHLVS